MHQTRRKIRQAAALAAALLTGAVAGGGAAVILMGNTVDQLVVDNALLMDEVETLAARLALFDARSAAGGPYVEAVEVSVTGVERARVALEQRVKALLAHLVGEEIDRVNAGTIHAAVERTFDLEDQTYALRVRYIYVAPTVRVEMEASAGSRLEDA